jgi:regulatory protein
MATHTHNPIYQLAKKKAVHYCSYQERTIAELAQKLLAWQVPAAEQKKLIQELQAERWLDEKRYIETFVYSRFCKQKWGRRKIYYALLQKQLHPADIENGLNTIQEAAYLESLKKLVVQKKEHLAKVAPNLIRQKITAYLLQKGYELDLIQQVIQATL